MSPIGLPDSKQWGDRDTATIPPYLSLAVEYAEQQRMKERFLYGIDRAVANGAKCG